MDPHNLPGGIPSRISGLTAALIRHLLALGTLAAEETRFLIRQSITGLILLTAMLVALVISYVSLIAAATALLARRSDCGWPIALGINAAFHLVGASVLFVLLRLRVSPRPYQATTAELQRDLEALGSYTRNNPSR